MPSLRAPVTVVVTPLECQSKPSTQPKAWNQYGSESRRSTSSAPYSATTCPMTSRERRTMREKSQAGALPPWRGSCAKPVRMITRPGYPRAAPGRVLLDADGADLLEVRDTPDDLLDAVLEQRRHPVPDRLLAQLLDGLSLLDLPLHLVGRDQKLVDAHPALVPGAPALGAALGPVQLERGRVADAERVPVLEAVALHQLRELLLGGDVFLLAVLAQRPHQALGHDPEESVSEVEGIDVHVQQAGDRLRRRVGVQGGGDEVAGARG